MKQLLFILCILPTLTVAQNLSVTTYNIRYDNSYDGINSWTEGNRKEKVFTIINDANPDIFGVQEALVHQLKFLEERFPTYQREGVGRDDGKEAGEHSAIFFKKNRFILLDKGNFWLSQTPDVPSLGWDATCCNRICSWVKLKDKKTIFWVFNLHFDHEGKVAQIQSADLVLRKIKEIAKNGKVILMGDFNLPTEHPAVQKIASQLYDTQLSPTNKTPNMGTFNAFKTDEPLKGHIDFIFVQKSIKVKQYKIIETRIDSLYPSDHLPVWVQLQLK
ncbi:endonuclease/exonuclease/phosphatase family protein [Capnocytophaga sputigena]|jgi:endonuclease/exonuclease/phosphatase|uniref:endonuclease/exonuclease/phosphatase family protein n=1 Tax=Capnocytophaga sputigena TaxID=1019 RepID=UPI0028D3C241|nr:endonuclease/exonuclease/phosphatase family protein [Capnocytophaga sputigena]